MVDSELQFAEVRLVRIRQEMEQEFGHYQELRRTATGVLQALDLGLIQADVMKSVTEELMITTPKYWLAPCMVALVGWATDRKQLAERALQEAIRRNAKKTSLFFALICRRYERWQASRVWFEQYFSQLHSQALDQEIIILLEGVTHGVFGADIRSLFLEYLEHWVEDIQSRPGWKEPERESWKSALIHRVVPFPEIDQYPYLKKHAIEWKEVEKAAQSVHYHSFIHQYFESVIHTDSTPSASIEEAIDDLLDRLVMQAEFREAELQQEERKAELIIQYGGDRTLAEDHFQTEQLKDGSHLNILEIFRRVALYPEMYGTTAITQRFAIAWCKSVILEAHEDVVAWIRNLEPMQVRIPAPSGEIDINHLSPLNQWICTIRDGSNEEEAKKSLEKSVKKSAKNQFKQNVNWRTVLTSLLSKHVQAMKYIFGILLVFFVFLPLIMNPFSLFGLVPIIVAILIIRDWKRKKPYRQEMNNLKENLVHNLYGSFADWVDFRRDFSREDQNAERLPMLLETLQIQETISSRYDRSRMIIR